VVHLAWKNPEGQLLTSLLSMKPHFLFILEIDRWILQCCQSILPANSANIQRIGNICS